MTSLDINLTMMKNRKYYQHKYKFLKSFIKLKKFYPNYSPCDISIKTTCKTNAANELNLCHKL